MTNADLVLLRVYVIALENVLIAVLVEGSDRQRQLARDMADVIIPRDGFTQHVLTIRAAQHMTDLVNRAIRYGRRGRDWAMHALRTGRLQTCILIKA